MNIEFHIDCNKDQLSSVKNKLLSLQESEPSLHMVSEHMDGDIVYLTLNGTWDAYREFSAMRKFSIYHYEED